LEATEGTPDKRVEILERVEGIRYYLQAGRLVAARRLHEELQVVLASCKR
jgi:hypothetical protein